jgi:hypothetical protein
MDVARAISGGGFQRTYKPVATGGPAEDAHHIGPPRLEAAAGGRTTGSAGGFPRTVIAWGA